MNNPETPKSRHSDRVSSMSVGEQPEEELRRSLVNFFDSWAFITTAWRRTASTGEAAAWHAAWHTAFASTIEFPKDIKLVKVLHVSKNAEVTYIIIGFATPSSSFCIDSYSSLVACWFSSNHDTTLSISDLSFSLSDASSFSSTLGSLSVLRRE
jgi:hypothetical protein